MILPMSLMSIVSSTTYYAKKYLYQCHSGICVPQKPFSEENLKKKNGGGNKIYWFSQRVQKKWLIFFGNFFDFFFDFIEILGDGGRWQKSFLGKKSQHRKRNQKVTATQKNYENMIKIRNFRSFGRAYTQKKSDCFWIRIVFGLWLFLDWLVKAENTYVDIILWE